MARMIASPGDVGDDQRLGFRHGLHHQLRKRFVQRRMHHYIHRFENLPGFSAPAGKDRLAGRRQSQFFR